MAGRFVGGHCCCGYRRADGTHQPIVFFLLSQCPQKCVHSNWSVTCSAHMNFLSFLQHFVFFHIKTGVDGDYFCFIRGNHIKIYTTRTASKVVESLLLRKKSTEGFAVLCRQNNSGTRNNRFPEVWERKTPSPQRLPVPTVLKTNSGGCGSSGGCRNRGSG